MKLNKIALAGALAGMLSSGTALAVQQGTVGATSEGRVVVTVTIPSLIRINGLSDIAFGIYAGTGDLAGYSDAAVCSNGAATYGLVPTSVNGAFELAGQTAGNTDTIPYTMDWLGAASPLLTYGANEGAIAVESTSLGVGCTPQVSKMGVFITEAALTAVQADDYQDTVILTVTPE